MEFLKAGIEFSVSFFGAMALFCFAICVAAIWLTGVISKLFDSNFLGAFLAFVFPPYGIAHALHGIYKEEAFRKRCKAS